MTRRLLPAASLVLPAAAALLLLWWSWRRWPDILIDFGRELYTPWQLSLGKHLYRDLAWFNGPLSAYFNAAWFRALGVSLTTIVWVNLAVLAGIVCLLHRLLTTLAGSRAALAGLLVFVTIFAFTQGDEHGNYNYVCPYSHELVHGLFLALLALFFFFRHARARGRTWIALTGLALGSTALTKIEVCAGAWVAVVAGLGLLRAIGRRPWRALATDGGWMIGAAIVPPLLAFVLLARAMPAAQAIGGLFLPYKALFLRSVTGSSFYRHGMGTDDVAGNLARMLMWTAIVAAALLPAAALGRFVGNGVRSEPEGERVASDVRGFRNRRGGVLVAAAALSACAILLLVRRTWDLSELPRALPFLVVLFAAMLVWRPNTPSPGGAPEGATAGQSGVLSRGSDRIADRMEPADPVRLIQRLTFAVFAFVLLWKTLLRANVYHYGFALSMPAAMFSVCALVEWLPDRARSARLLRSAALAFLLGLIVLHLGGVRLWYRAQNETVSTGGDTIRTDIRGFIVNRALTEIRRDVGPEQTLAVFPEGVMLNYLARRSSSIRFINFMPPELALFGEGAILAALDAHPPDFIAFFYRPTNEYGYRGLGTDYGVAIADWIRRNYTPITTIEGAPGAQLFGRMVFLRQGRP